MSRPRHRAPGARRAEPLLITRMAEPLDRRPINRRERRQAAHALRRPGNKGRR